MALAKVKYKKGGKVKYKKGGTVKYEKGGEVKGKKDKEEEEELTASQEKALQELKYKEMDKKMQEAAENAPTTKRNMGKYARGGKVTLRKSRDGIARKGHTRAT